ncbi:MAG: amidase [Burkholderiaceae bacterium]|nr:amidase [Burkholderiaceae bacterium]
MNTSPDPCELDADTLSAMIHRREISCRELMTAFLRRIESINPQVNAIVSMRDPQALLAEADAHDAALAAGASSGWMHGLPVAVKDLSDVAGIRTTMGSPILRDNIPAVDGLMVARMRAAGAILIGKTNTPEFGLGSQTYNPVFGATRNAWDTSLCAGGSSGGAAVALALRMLPVADGSDMGGSLRNPAAYANVFGFRPSQGRVPKYPAPERFFQQLGIEGPMGRTVTDVAKLFAVQAGHDPRTPLSPDAPGACFDLPPTPPSRPIRVGWFGDLDGYLPMEEGVLPLCEAALDAFEVGGARVEPLGRATLGVAPEAVWDAWMRLRSLLVGGSLSAHYNDASRRELLKPEARWEVENAMRTGALEVYSASVVRTALFDALNALFERFDLLAMPSAQVFAFDVRKHWPDSVSGRAMDTYHRWMEVVIYATLAGCPVIGVPAGFDARGRAMGLQLIGAPRRDLDVLRAARVYEEATGWPGSRMPDLSRGVGGR